jgi:hypothetical protein
VTVQARHQIRVQVWKNDMISGENSTGIGVLIYWWGIHDFLDF